MFGKPYKSILNKVICCSVIKTFTTNKEDRKRVEKVLDSTGIPSTKNEVISIEKFGFDDFFTFYKNLTQRTEVEKVFYDM